MSILEVVFSGSRHTLYWASVNLSAPSRHETPNPSLTFSPVPVCWFHICLMTWFPQEKTTAPRASTFTSHGILKMSQFLFTTSCYRLSLILGLRWIYLENCFSRENVSAKLIFNFFPFLLGIVFLWAWERPWKKDAFSRLPYVMTFSLLTVPLLPKLNRATKIQ